MVGENIKHVMIDQLLNVKIRIEISVVFKLIKK